MLLSEKLLPVYEFIECLLGKEEIHVRSNAADRLHLGMKNCKDMLRVVRDQLDGHWLPQAAADDDV